MKKKGEGRRKNTQYQTFQVRLKQIFKMKFVLFHHFPPSENSREHSEKQNFSGKCCSKL